MKPGEHDSILKAPSLLSHLSVLEVSNGLASRYAGRLLADLGARVSRIVDGSPTDSKTLLDDYLDANKGVVETQAFDASLIDACKEANITLVDGSNDTLTATSLTARASELGPVVLAICTPYGLDSPYRQLCGDELFFAALSGIASVTPEEFEDRRDERPMQMYGHQASLLGGLTLAVACLQAVRTVRQTGDARVIDFSVVDALNSVPIISQAAGFRGQQLPAPPSLRPQTVPRGFSSVRTATSTPRGATTTGLDGVPLSTGLSGGGRPGTIRSIARTSGRPWTRR